MEDVIKNITKNKDAAIKFLKSAGIMDDNGELSEMYRSEQRPIEWSKDFEENIRILLHDKLTWRSKDGSISSLVVIDDKTLKDIVTGIWFYVGKEASKYPNKELKVEQKPAEKQSMLKKLREHLANTPKEQLDTEFEALKDLTIDKPADCIEFDNEFKNQVSHLLASVINKEWKYDREFVKYAAQQLIGYAKHEINPTKWSEEDKDMLLSAIEYIQTYPAHRQSVVDWLKNLPNRFCLQYKQEWSKEEKGILLECVTALQNSSHWLLADKLSYLSLQPQWKPSEEQIEALEWMLTTVSFKDGGYGVVLKNLINDLKKQM